MPVPNVLKVLQYSAKCSQKCVQICFLLRSALALRNLHKIKMDKNTNNGFLVKWLCK